MKKLMLSLSLLTVLLFACKEEENNDEAMNIVELAQENADLSILVDAVTQAGYADVLSGDGPFTVFAPTNQAFQDLLDSDPTWNSLSDIPSDVLESVLLFHVLNGKVMAADLADGYANTLSTGPNSEAISLQINTQGGVTFNGNAMPMSTDIEASNGVVHVIDRVMLPPSLVNLALNNSEFTSLVAALTDSRHTTNYVSVLSSQGPFTVFAPTNQAFQDLLDSNPAWSSIADIDIATLEAVLNYHVVNGANVQSDELTDNQMVTMFSGGDITIDLTNGVNLETTSGQSVSVAAADVQGTNGVVHVIGEVLLP